MKSKSARLDFLKETHRRLDEQIKKGYSSFLDDSDMSKMKIQKLRYKEEIAKLEKELDNEVRDS